MVLIAVSYVFVYLSSHNICGLDVEAGKGENAGKPSVGKAAVEYESAEKDGPKVADNEDKSEDVDRPGPWAFHLIMCLSGLYMSMMLTNWGASDAKPEAGTTGVGWESLWVKIISQWLTILLYTWTLVAPVLMPDRDFSPGVGGNAF